MVAGFLERIVKARKDTGLGHRTVAKMIGLGATTLRDMEKGRTPFPIERVYKLAEIYDVSLVWLVTGISPNFDAEGVKSLLEQALKEMENA